MPSNPRSGGPVRAVMITLLTGKLGEHQITVPQLHGFRPQVDGQVIGKLGKSVNQHRMPGLRLSARNRFGLQELPGEKGGRGRMTIEVVLTIHVYLLAVLVRQKI